MNINEYLLDNPKMVEVLFTKIFGKYMLRYYDQTGYVVEFSTSEPTSYQNAEKKRIVISLENVITMLQSNIHVLAVAYHELAHTLYTDNDVRDKIRKKANDLVIEQMREDTTLDSHELHVAVGELYAGNHLHNVWNVLEDTRIERLLGEDFPFLKEIIEPLKTMIDPQKDHLFMWRSEKGSPRQDIVDEAEAFCTKKKVSQLSRAKNIANIFIKLYLKDLVDKSRNGNRTSSKEKESSARTKVMENKRQEAMKDMYSAKQRHAKDIQEKLEDTLQDLEKDNLTPNEKDALSERRKKLEEWLESKVSESKELARDYLESYNKDITEQNSPYEQLETIKKLDIETTLDSAIKDILFKAQNTIIENQENISYNDSVENYPNNIDTMFLKKAKLYYNPKQSLRQGITASQSKKYSIDLSNKVNVGRIVSSKANRTAPQVFYNRGKDISFTRKVVVFEDISSSTTDFTHLFSSIAYSLSQAFDSVEWWGYGNKLFLKKPKDYQFLTRNLGSSQHLDIHGTEAYRLLNVMKKYKNLDYTYVIITDGDMSSVFKDKETWDYFKNKTVVTGFLTQDIKKNSPHSIDLFSEIAKLNGYYPTPQDDLQDISNYANITRDTFHDELKLMPIIYKGIDSVMQLVKNRLK
jgi:hypothetical protein